MEPRLSDPGVWLGTLVFIGLAILLAQVVTNVWTVALVASCGVLFAIPALSVLISRLHWADISPIRLGPPTQVFADILGLAGSALLLAHLLGLTQAIGMSLLGFGLVFAVQPAMREFWHWFFVTRWSGS
jgi:hypothetical protein